MQRAQLGWAGLLLLFAAPLAAQGNYCEVTEQAKAKAALLIDSVRAELRDEAAAVARMFRDTRPRGAKAMPLVTPLVSYTQTRLAPKRIRAIRAALERCQFNTALELYFGDARDPDLPDWVVYIPGNGEARHSLIRGSDSTGVYRAQRYVWAIVFADKPGDWAGPFQRDTLPTAQQTTRTTTLAVQTDSGTLTKTLATTKAAATPPGPHLEFRRRMLKYESDPYLAAALKFGTSKFLGAAVEAGAAKDSNDAQPQVRMSQLSSDTTESLFVGTGRQGLVTNAQVVLSLHPAPGRDMPGALRDVYANLVNSSPSHLEFGLAVGASFASGERLNRVAASAKDTVRSSPAVRPNVLFVAYWNRFHRPSLPLDHRAWSLAIGASAANLLDDFFVGIATTQTKAKLGGLIGVLIEKNVDVNGTTTPATRTEWRRGRFFLGLDLRI